MSHCGCAASQDLQCVHVRNTQHSLAVQVEGYTHCDPCLLAPACCNQHIGRTPSGTAGTKEVGQRRRASRYGGVDIYDKCLELTHLGVSSWKVVSGCTSRPYASHRHPVLCWSAYMVFGYENRKSGEGKKWHRKLFNVLCIQQVDDGHNNTPVIFKTVPAAVWLFLCWRRHFFILSIIQV